MEIIDSFTACSTTLHLRQDFSLGLTPPTSDEIQTAKGQLQFKTAGTDDDDDFLAKGGRVGSSGIIKSLQIVPSQNAARVSTMSATTEQCFDTLYLAFSILYSRNSSEVDKGLEYADFETVTKVQLGAPLYGVFSDEMKEQVAQWKDLGSGMLLNVLADGDSWKQNCAGLLDLSGSVFDRLYEGQKNALVMPSNIEFTISIPTNYHKLSHHKVAIYARSVEDFQNNIYFVKSEFPYRSHIAIIKKIAGENQ